VIVRARGTVSYTNLSTGATATDDGRFVFTIADGHVVLDATTGELVSFTPNTQLGYAAVVCEMLGAEPAA
jgi:hypothetical protein